MRAQAVISLVSLALLTPATSAANFDVYPNHNRDAPNSAPSKSSLFPFLKWLRNGAVEFVFGPHPSKASSHPTSHARASLRNNHINEVVLRFNLTTPEEETAFANAATRTFLDIWAFTHDFVDVRLRQDDVRSLLRLLPKSLESSYSTLIIDLAAAVYDTYPALDTPAQIRRFENGRASLKPSPSETDNYFFQDYQKLDVGDSPGPHPSKPPSDLIKDNRPVDALDRGHVPCHYRSNHHRAIVRRPRHPWS